MRRAAAIEGLALPITPSHGESPGAGDHRGGDPPRGAGRGAYRRQGIMIRQGTYHTRSVSATAS